MLRRFRRRSGLSHRSGIGIRLNRSVNPTIIEATRLFEVGDYQRAGTHFETIGDDEVLHAGLRAYQFYLLAGRSWLLASKIERGMDLIKKGLEIIVQQHEWVRLHRTVERTILALQRLNLAEQAKEIEEWKNSLFPTSNNMVEPTSTHAVSTKTKLPTICPHCGGRVHPDEVDWINESQVECIYCGSILDGND